MFKDFHMTRTLSRLALGLGLTAALLGTCLPALAQTADATAPADGVAMGVPDGIPDRTTALHEKRRRGGSVRAVSTAER